VDPAAPDPAVAPAPIPIDWETPFVLIVRHPRGVGTLVVGALLLLLSWLILPALVLIGFGIHLGRNIAHRSYDLPHFHLGLAMDGLRAVVVGFVYLLPMFLMFVLAAALGGSGNTASLTTLPLIFVLYALMIGYALALAALHPAIFATLIADDRIASCFSPGRIRQVIAARRWMYLGVAASLIGLGQIVYVGLFGLVVGIGLTGFYYLVISFCFAGQLAQPLLTGAPYGLTPYGYGPQAPVPAYGPYGYGPYGYGPPAPAYGYGAPPPPAPPYGYGPPAPGYGYGPPAPGYGYGQPPPAPAGGYAPPPPPTESPPAPQPPPVSEPPPPSAPPGEPPPP